MYITTSLVIIPAIAPQFGRVSLPIFETNGVRPASILTCLLNRHYVTPDMEEITFKMSSQLRSKIPDAEILYLDANFPFLDGFPLLPHWSHSDGKKLDLGFIYRDSDNQIANDLPTHFGYGSFEPAKQNEYNAAKECANKGAFQYGFLKYFTWFPANYEVDEQSTSLLIKLLHNHSEVQKIFIEPHLKTRWKLSNYSKIRFHGCHAVRHDDHIHFQIN